MGVENRLRLRFRLGFIPKLCFFNIVYFDHRMGRSHFQILEMGVVVIIILVETIKKILEEYVQLVWGIERSGKLRNLPLPWLIELKV